MSGVIIEAWHEGDLWPDDCSDLLLIGPPGTGKTHTLLNHYLLPLLAKDRPVLALSFTRSAALELRLRVGRHFDRPEETYRDMLSTLHSEASRRTRHLGFRVGRAARAAPAAPEVASDAASDDATMVLASAEEEDQSISMSAWDRTRAEYPEDIDLPIRDRLARRLHGRDLDEAEAEVRRDRADRYEDGRLVRPDYTDSLEQALRRGVSRQIDVLAVDEAQDLTPLQWTLVTHWGESARRRLYVGDPDQAIYEWSGADGRRLLSWVRSGRPVRRLSQSYRVPRVTHAWAREIIGTVTDRVDAPYAAHSEDGSILHTDDPAEAWTALAARVRALSAGDAPPQDQCLVLARTRVGVSWAIDDLIGADIPHLAERGRKLLGESMEKSSRAVRCVRALSELLTGSGRPLGADLRILIGALKSGPILPRGTKKTLMAYVSAHSGPIDRTELRNLGMDVVALADAWGDADMDVLEALVLDSVSVADLMIVRDWLLEYGSMDAVFLRASRVHVTTCHGSKGREGRMVVLDARKGSGAWGRGGSVAEQDEDRRLLYVAVTRTQDALICVRGDRDWITQVTGD